MKVSEIYLSLSVSASAALGLAEVEHRCSVCRRIKQYAVEHLKSKADILAIDETGFLKPRETISSGCRNNTMAQLV